MRSTRSRKVTSSKNRMVPSGAPVSSASAVAVTQAVSARGPAGELELLLDALAALAAHPLDEVADRLQVGAAEDRVPALPARVLGAHAEHARGGRVDRRDDAVGIERDDAGGDVREDALDVAVALLELGVDGLELGGHLVERHDSVAISSSPPSGAR